MPADDLKEARSTMIDQLRVSVHDSTREAGTRAATRVAATLRQRLASHGRARIIFAAAPSQDAVLRALHDEPDIDWSRVTAFQMDEYVGLVDGHPQAFGSYLRERIYRVLQPGQVHVMRPDADGTSEAERYAELLAEAPIDAVCMGIGENGHIAFNEPGVADFDDPLAVKLVELDPASRRQQVNDGCFATLDEVPTHAVTVTVPVLLSATTVACSVFGTRKRGAVWRALSEPISADRPASVLRRHPDAWLFLDHDSMPPELSSRPEPTH